MLERDSPERGAVMARVIQRHIKAELGARHYAIPARVTTFDAGTQRASFKPVVKKAHLDESDQRQVDALPVIPNVPVLFWSFRIMVGVGLWLILLFATAFTLSAKRRLDRHRVFLWVALFAMVGSIVVGPAERSRRD